MFPIYYGYDSGYFLIIITAILSMIASFKVNSTFKKYSKKLTGRNYIELVQEKRLNQAAYLLDNTNMSVMNVGLSVGYDNLSYFHRIFTGNYGLSPRHYRLQERTLF